MSNLLLLPCRKPSLYIPGNHHVDTYNMNICKYHYEMKKMNEYKSEPAQCEENAQKKVRCLVNLFLFFFPKYIQSHFTMGGTWCGAD